MMASVITVPANALPADETGWALATRMNLPLPANLGNDGILYERHVLHVQPGKDPTTIEGATVIWDATRNGPIAPEMLAQGWPKGSLYVLEAEWLDSEGVMQRTKMIEVPQDITPTATHIVGHKWLGDE